MFRGPMSANELLLAVVPGVDGDSVLHYARVDGLRVRRTGEGVPRGFSGPIRASVYSSASYFEQVDLVAANQTMRRITAVLRQQS